MGKRIELTGQVFGRLTVIEFSCVENNRTYWLCHCECGNEKIIDGHNLKSGATKSCGCYSKEKTRETHFQDLTGQKFGRLTVIKFSYVKNGISYWLCRCDCGVEKIISSCNFKSGGTQSCGCLQKECATEFQNLIGQRFGRLIVVEHSYIENNKFYWLCRCDCGKQKIIRSDSLQSKRTTSCGCYNRQKSSNYQSGQNNINWRDGNSKKPYPVEWTEELKENVRNRDNRKCQFSDCEYDDTREITKLHVHHIDGNKQNCEAYNLISLCNSHHQIIEHNNPELWIDYFYQITGDYG